MITAVCFILTMPTSFLSVFLYKRTAETVERKLERKIAVTMFFVTFSLLLIGTLSPLEGLALGKTNEQRLILSVVTKAATGCGIATLGMLVGYKVRKHEEEIEEAEATIDSQNDE
jgi:hypothetical protein